MKTIARALVGATLLCVLAPSVASAGTCAPAASEAVKPKKKKGLGLGGLMGAARRAGVGNLLGTGYLLGNGKAAEVAGAVAGTAVAASEGGDPAAAVQGRVAGLAGSGRTAQIAGAATGMVGELARTQNRERSAKAQAPATTCPADADAAADKAWN
jgi:hypothetical protein